MFDKKKKKIISIGIMRNAAYSRLLIDCFVTAFRILIKHIGTNFLSMAVFKELALDLTQLLHDIVCVEVKSA